MESQVRQNYHRDCEAAINRMVNMELFASYTYTSMVRTRHVMLMSVITLVSSYISLMLDKENGVESLNVKSGMLLLISVMHDFSRSSFVGCLSQLGRLPDAECIFTPNTSPKNPNAASCFVWLFFSLEFSSYLGLNQLNCPS